MGSPPNAACAACKFQRRKCAVDCLLAPWFPPDQHRRFANAHRLFGVAKILRLIRENRSSVQDLMMSVCFESDARERDPVSGEYGILRRLQREAERLEENITALSEKLRILLVEDAAANHVNNAPHSHSAYNAVPPEYYAHARPSQVAETTPALQDNCGYHMQQQKLQHQQPHQQQQHLHYMQMPQQQHQQQQPHQKQQQLHYMQMAQQQMLSLEYFVNFNAVGGGGFPPVQATHASTSHPLMHFYL
ncbi:protein MpASLBD16 [Marchantia polymorpha subsp. ruderalis]|uniref:LOB domain-containing protein n=2 Tax=Marchantia polymorpha TaxID=3197 RepID=A0AAF6BPA5_MARPO|nr:hypothetical protein MARPO_0173s0030 [Marchantia polymorpha]BBN13839.1 hypothetical protein Mp_6g06850 [Marchantia polymorpha subsp. ruderalis]|eukprot:PTQ28128.1 hypothetical protein MARPO_0173s0030 [Marchantia polymorpha]